MCRLLSAFASKGKLALRSGRNSFEIGKMLEYQKSGDEDGHGRTEPHRPGRLLIHKGAEYVGEHRQQGRRHNGAQGHHPPDGHHHNEKAQGR